MISPSGDWVVRYSARGYPYWSWEFRLPRIDDAILDCAIYLYPTVDAADQGVAAGGSGFLVGVRSEVHKNISYVYAVTNSHVIQQGASPVIRLNTKGGDKDVIEMSERQWFHHPDGDDIAICAIGLSPEHHRFKFISAEMFLTREIGIQYNIGPGDDVFVIGRLSNHEGRQRNIPSVRFGNVSILPWEPIVQPFRGFPQESFVVEVRSIAGYSGSPVFVQILPFSPRPGRKELDSQFYGLWLLGIDWGHINTASGTVNIPPGINTGMMGVVPAWRLATLLNVEPVLLHRRRQDEKISRKQESATLDALHFTPPTD